MRRVLLSIVLVMSASVCHAQRSSVDAIIERYDASFTMTSATSGTYKVNMKVHVLSKDASDVAVFSVYSDGFRSLSSFNGTLESGGKIIKKYKMSDVKTVSMAEGGITDVTMSYLSPVAPVPYTVEYTYEVAYKNGFISFPSFIPLSDPDVALASASYTLAVPTGTEIMMRSSVEPSKTGTAKADVYEWKVSDVQGYVYEHMMPSVLEMIPYVYAAPKSFVYAKTTGSQNDWNEAGRWLYGLQKDALTLSEEFRSKVLALVDGLETDRQKIKALYDYLRKNTRYVSIQLGIGGLKPFPAEMVMTSGFGDCKALSIYMQALLDVAGIRSEYLIVDTGRRNLMDGIYTVGQMDHAMLCVPMQKDTLWVECTNPRLPIGYRHDNIAGHEVVLVGEDGGKKVRVRPYEDSLSYSVESVDVVLYDDGSAHCKGMRYLSLDQVEPYIGFADFSEKAKFNAVMGANSLNPVDFKIDSVEDNFDDWVDMDDGEEYVPHMQIGYSFGAYDYAKVSGDRIFLNLNPFAKQMHADRKPRVNDFVRTRSLVVRDEVSVLLPEGYSVEAMPSTSEISTQFGVLKTDVQLVDAEDGKKMVVSQTLSLSPGRYSKDEYEVYKTFAKDVSKAYSARVVLKKD